MLRIKQAQLDHFADRARDRFVRLMVDYLRDSFAPRVEPMDAAALERWVRRALGKCEKYGVIMEPEAAQLLLILLLLGLDADQEHPWVAEAISADVAPIGKVRRLVAECRARGVADLDDVLVFDDMFKNVSMEA